MIIVAFIFLFTTVVNFFFVVFQNIFDITLNVTGINIASGLSYIFGNLMLFNTVLPITELLYLAGIAITFKGFILGVDIFFFIWGLTGRIKSFFISWR